MRFDHVAGYHLNYLTCGIAKFNLLLGQRMELPFYNLYDRAADRLSAPLLSVKLSEFTPEDLAALPGWMDRMQARGGYAVFLHGYDGTALEEQLVRRANVVYCGNTALHARLLPLNPNCVALWCPGTNMSNHVFGKTDLTVFSFGMAHKLKTDKYYRLRELLEGTGRTYSILLSTALHEGTSFDESFIEVFNEMRAIFDDRVYFLGYLSDQAVYNYLLEADYFSAFFDGGVRANNTSVNTALEAGVAVITNLDDHSPRELVHLRNVIDINRADRLPHDDATLDAMRAEARRVGSGQLGWPLLIERLAGTP